MSEIVISYARANRDFAEALALQLGTKWSVWWDNELRGGDQFREVIEKHIEDAKVVVVLWSTESRTRPFVRDEARLALEQQKLVGVLIDDATVPLGFGESHTIDLRGWQGVRKHEGYDRLESALTQRLTSPLTVEGDSDATAMRALRDVLARIRRSGRLAIYLAMAFFVIHGAGLLDTALGIDGRLRVLLVAARHSLEASVLDDRLLVVVIDDVTQTKLRTSSVPNAANLGQLGPFGPRWRGLVAQALTAVSKGGARAVALDLTFSEQGSMDVASETAALAQAIEGALRRGTAIAFVGASGSVPNDGKIAAAVKTTAIARGTLAHPCLGIDEGWAARVPLLLTSPQRPSPGAPALSLAATAGFWGLDILQPPIDGELILSSAGSSVHRVRVAGYDAALGDAAEMCPGMLPNDRAAQFIIDVSANELRRGHEQVIPFEDLLVESPSADFRGKLVVLGTQLTGIDRHRVLTCDETLWSCGVSLRWGVNLHVDAVNNLLRGISVRTIGPLTQLTLILLLCFAAASLQLLHRGTLISKRMLLVALLAFNLIIVIASAMFIQYIMDATYQLAAVLTTYYVAGKLPALRSR